MSGWRSGVWIFLLLVASSPGWADEQTYAATLVACHDGDTCDVVIDLGFGLTLTETIRLARINAWEVTGEERPKGEVAKVWLNEQVQGQPVQLGLLPRLRDKYGRILAELVHDGVNLNNAMVREGHARYQDY